MKLLYQSGATHFSIGYSPNSIAFAKINQAALDLEELELQVKALKQARSGIVVPGMQFGNNKG